MECRRRLSMGDTLVESFMLVSGQHTNALGVLHGGNLLRWLVDLSSTVASRVAMGYSLLAGIDFVYIASPAREGETLALRSWATLTGRSSVEVVAEAVSLGLPVGYEEPRRVALSHMTFVAVDGSLRPRPHFACVEPRSGEEEAMAKASGRLREERLSRIASRREEPFDTSPPPPARGGESASTSRIVNPSDTIAYNVMHAGSMLFLVDELGAIVASRQAKAPVVTGFLGPMDFYRPVLVGYSVTAWGAVVYTGRSSIEVELKVVAGPLGSGWAETVARGYATYIRLGADGRPSPLPPDAVVEPVEGTRERAEERKRIISMIEGGELPFKPPARA